MATENDFLVFAGGSSANVITQAQYAALAALLTGFQSGVAASNQLNKVWRQSSIMSAMIAQFIVDKSGQPAIDDGTTATLEANFELGIKAVASALDFTPLAGVTNTATEAMNGDFLQWSHASNGGFILPGTGPGVLPLGWQARLQNNSAGAILSVTVGSGANLQNSSTGIIYLGPKQSCLLISDGANYWGVDVPALAELAATSTFYVSTTGNDANDGLTSATAFLTMQEAWNTLVGNFTLNSQNVNIEVGAGTYTAGVSANGPASGFSNDNGINFIGSSGNPDNTVINANSSAAFSATNGAAYTINGFQLNNSGGSAINAFLYGEVAFKNIDFGTCSGTHISAHGMGAARCTGNYEITGNAGVAHISTSQQGLALIDGTAYAITVTINGSPNLNVFAQIGASQLYIPGVTFNGTPTCQRYSANFNGVIYTGTGGNPNYLPGTSAGGVINGGVYQ